jgi:hypothetical protein
MDTNRLLVGVKRMDFNKHRVLYLVGGDTRGDFVDVSYTFTFGNYKLVGFKGSWDRSRR